MQKLLRQFGRLRETRWWLATCCLPCLLLLSSCSFPGLVSTSAQLSPENHKQVTLHRVPTKFPQDEGAHNDLSEWWSYGGHLEAVDSTGQPHQYGFELAISQELRSDLPPVYPAQFAISDITRGEFHSAQQSISKLYGNNTANTATKGIDVQSGSWSIQGLDGKDHLVAAMNDYSINLDLTGVKPLTLHNGNGLLNYGTDGFSYYYSRTRMAVAGTIIDHYQTLQVTGLAWMDHRWGNFITLSNESKDWYGLQLNNNTEIMIYVMRNATGAITATYASYVDAAGNADNLPPTALGTTVLGQWTSKVTGITYPSGWRLDINTPSLQARLMVMPISQNQEVTNSSTSNASWEGGVGVQGQMNGNAINGQGCVELTGYSKAS